MLMSRLPVKTAEKEEQRGALQPTKPKYTEMLQCLGLFVLSVNSAASSGIKVKYASCCCRVILALHLNQPL